MTSKGSKNIAETGSQTAVPDSIKNVGVNVWEIPTSFKKGMLVPARVYANDELLAQMDKGVFDQVTNVASLPGIQQNAFCMPDGHWGYGFPIGGVAAFDPKEGGVISPGGIGFDINCGMRLMRTNLHVSEVQPKIKELMHLLYEKVPAGVGKKGTLQLTQEEFDRVMIEGASFVVEKGLGWPEDVEHIESKGKIPGADPSKVSAKARKRGINQLGTLGSGNHYLEVQVADSENVTDEKAAAAFGIDKDGQVVVMVHCGSRGFGHQIGTDYLRMFVEETMPKYNISILDKELACAPFDSEEGQAYFAAMACGANMAFANRQVITHRIREAFSEVFGKTAREMEMFLVYDVAHNIAKVEKHKIDGVEKELVVHRKGSTRAFGPGRADELPEDYREVGQPVILGGSMETGSYLLVGQDGSEATFGSTAHGAGRVMSRMKAKRLWKGDELQKKMESDGIYVKGASMKGLAEEAGGAYKDVHSVVACLEEAGITKRVAMLRPIGNIKG
ncbi:RtcB family protein [archaeon]|nr:RtcB family protein [archaeon]MBT6762819.1 RtcB family protein [archaeon]